MRASFLFFIFLLIMACKVNRHDRTDGGPCKHETDIDPVFLLEIYGDSISGSTSLSDIIVTPSHIHS